MNANEFIQQQEDKAMANFKIIGAIGQDQQDFVNIVSQIVRTVIQAAAEEIIKTLKEESKQYANVTDETIVEWQKGFYQGFTQAILQLEHNGIIKKTNHGSMWKKKGKDHVAYKQIEPKGWRIK